MGFSINSTEAGTGIAAWNELAFRLRSAEVVKGSGAVQLKQQLIFSYALIVVTSGVVQFILDRRQVELGAGSVCLCMPEQTFGMLEPTGSLEMYILHFDVFQSPHAEASSFTLTKEAQLFPYNSMFQVYPVDSLAPMCSDLYRLAIMQENKVGFRAQIDFQELLYYIRNNNKGKPEDANSVIELAKLYIEENYTSALTIEQLAQVAEFSPKYFADLFKKKYGKSVMEYVSELRLQQAKRLMAENGVRLRDIAHRVGYVDEFYFSRKFKKEIGVPPTVYMKKRHRKLVAYGTAILGQLLPLNIMPYAATLHPKWTEYYYREYRSDIPVHISAYRNNQEWQANLEILQQVPADLIIAADPLLDEEKQELERMAEVFYLLSGTAGWREQFLLLADYLGETWQAEQWLGVYDRKIQSSRKRLHRQLGSESVVVIRMLGSGMYLHCNPGMADLLYRELELNPSFASPLETYNHPVTPKEIAALGADHLLMLIRQESETLGEWKKLQNDAGWQRIPAVQRHRVHHLTSDPWREHSAYAMQRKLAQILQLLSVDCP